jgi:hypothetical protein
VEVGSFSSCLTNGNCWNLVGFMGDSSGRGMIFCYWQNLVKGPCHRKSVINVRTFLLCNNFDKPLAHESKAQVCLRHML